MMFTLTALFLFTPAVVACYARPERAIYMNSFGYQYVFPSEKWMELTGTDTELSIEGPEGRIDVEFLKADFTEKPEDVFNDVLSELPDTATFTVSEYRRNGTTYFFARIEGLTSHSSETSSYLLVFSLADERVVIARGQSQQQYHRRFESLYKNFVYSLALFEPPNPANFSSNRGQS
jgi:hypothetical protein